MKLLLVILAIFAIFQLVNSQQQLYGAAVFSDQFCAANTLLGLAQPFTCYSFGSTPSLLAIINVNGTSTGNISFFSTALCGGSPLALSNFTVGTCQTVSGVPGVQSYQISTASQIWKTTNYFAGSVSNCPYASILYQAATITKAPGGAACANQNCTCFTGSPGYCIQSVCSISQQLQPLGSNLIVSLTYSDQGVCSTNNITGVYTSSPNVCITSGAALSTFGSCFASGTVGASYATANCTGTSTNTTTNSTCTAFSGYSIRSACGQTTITTTTTTTTTTGTGTTGTTTATTSGTTATTSSSSIIQISISLFVAMIVFSVINLAI